MKKLKVGILSTGNIAGVMAVTLNGMKEAELYAVASRNIEKAQAFAGKFGASRAYGSYEELAADEHRFSSGEKKLRSSIFMPP